MGVHLRPVRRPPGCLPICTPGGFCHLGDAILGDGIPQAQPRRGSYLKWGEVAGVLSHMVGGKRVLANELSIIIHRIRRLERDDPMRATEETALVDVVMRVHRRSAVPLGDGAYPLLAAPGGLLAHLTLPGPSGAPPDPRCCPP